jgi:hypothetical protein
MPSTPASSPVKGIRHKKAVKPAKLKPKTRQAKPKVTRFDQVMGVDKPLYSKEEGGLNEGAKSQFENRYGKLSSAKDALFLKNLGKKMAAKKDGKRVRKKKIADQDFEFAPQVKESRLGRGKRKTKGKPAPKMNL